MNCASVLHALEPWGNSALQALAVSRDFSDAFRDLFEKERRGAHENDGPSRAKLEVDLAWNREKVKALEMQLQQQQEQLDIQGACTQAIRKQLREHAAALEGESERLRE